MAQYLVKETMDENATQRVLAIHANAEIAAGQIVENIRKSDELCCAIETQIRCLVQHMDGKESEAFFNKIARKLVSVHFDFGRHRFTHDMMYEPLAIELLEVGVADFLPVGGVGLLHECQKHGFITFTFDDFDNGLRVVDTRDELQNVYILPGNPENFPNEERKRQAGQFFKFAYFGPTLLRWLYIRKQTIEKCCQQNAEVASMIATSSLKDMATNTTVPMIHAFHQRLCSVLLKLLKFNMSKAEIRMETYTYADAVKK